MMDKFDQLKAAFRMLLDNYPLSRFTWMRIQDAPSHVVPRPLYSISKVIEINITKDKIEITDDLRGWYDRQHCNKEVFDVTRCIKQYSFVVRNDCIESAAYRVLKYIGGD